MAASRNALPKVLVFDLDGCVWYPEMYMLWGGNGGSPFKHVDHGVLVDNSGRKVELMANVREIMNNFKTDVERWKNSKIAVASSCDEPSWARECIKIMTLGPEGHKLKDVFDPNLVEIYKSAKSTHLKAISKKTGVELKDMIFFDNERGNCQTVAKAGVTVVYTPDGVTKELFEEGLNKFPAPGEIVGKGRGGYF